MIAAHNELRYSAHTVTGLYFRYPAKIVGGELTAVQSSKCKRFLATGMWDVIYVQGHNVYYCQKTHKLKFETQEHDLCVFIVVKDKAFFAYSHHTRLTGKALEQDITRKLVDGMERVSLMITEWNVIFNDIAAFNIQLADEAAAKREEKARQKLIEEEKRRLKETEQAEQHEAYLDCCEEDFRKGRKIPFSAFENLCKRHKVDIHIRTLGAARKHIHRIAHDHCSTAKPVNGIWRYTHDLRAILTTKGNQ